LLSVWSISLATAGILAAISLVERLWSPPVVPSKGSVAPYTIRARQDAVFDLHETVVAEAREAKQAYVPIYDKDNQLLFDYRERIVKAALSEAPSFWRWLSSSSAEAGDAGPEAGPLLEGPPLPPEAGVGAPDAGVDAGVASVDPLAGARLLQERRQELEALVRGCVRLLVPFYQDGVVGDSEFPKEKSTMRIFSQGRYVFRGVEELHRFSDLRPALRQSARQFFFKTNAELRDQVIEFILQRLPPNVTYAQENEKFIGDISQVTGMKVVLIRRGDILVKRGHVVDTRAYYAIRASIQAAKETSALGRLTYRLLLLISLLFVVVVGTRVFCPRTFNSVRPYLLVYSGMVLLVGAGEAALVYLPTHVVVLPQAALALVMAVVLGRGPGIITGLAVPAVLVVTQIFDLSTLAVASAGGVAAALAVRKRRRGSALAAGVLVGLVQAVAFEACRVIEGRPQVSEELWSAAAAFGGGLLAGVGALICTPIVEWLMGRSSRGKLKVLTDFDHALVRELREQAPGTFAHTVNLINMVEMATDAVGGDRLLARAGTLFHDVGKMVEPQYFIENQGQGPNVHDSLTPEQSARAILAHIPEGLKIARKHRLPPDVVAFIPEHHGTTSMAFFLARAQEQGAQEQGAEVQADLFHYPGPKPRSIETAILMVADSVEAASRTLPSPTEEALGALVDRIVLKKFEEQQFDECSITQGDLRRIKTAFVAYLKGALHRRVEYPSQKAQDGGQPGAEQSGPGMDRSAPNGVGAPD